MQENCTNVINVKMNNIIKLRMWCGQNWMSWMAAMLMLRYKYRLVIYHKLLKGLENLRSNQRLPNQK